MSGDVSPEALAANRRLHELRARQAAERAREAAAAAAEPTEGPAAAAPPGPGRLWAAWGARAAWGRSGYVSHSEGAINPQTHNPQPTPPPTPPSPPPTPTPAAQPIAAPPPAAQP
ncbi:MAG: hypothetical protein KJ046_12620, partial [Anaerolineae bacterium]|nr:hypothetical protein [Anaerolineae bacterium]